MTGKRSTSRPKRSGVTRPRQQPVVGDPLVGYLQRVPAVRVLSSGRDGTRWWTKLAIDVEHRLAWRVIQELAHVLNYLSTTERLPTRFYPVSPPPYLNGGPEGFLSWVIESTVDDFLPETAAKWLEGRLPRPVDDPSQWDED